MATSAMDRRFEIAGQQLKRQEAQQLQKEQEALRRRFAATGSLGSGASIKAESLAGEASSRRQAEGQQQVEFAKLGEQARQEDITSQRAYQTGERVGSQEFASGQAKIGREFATSERVDTQKSAAELAREGWSKTAIENALNRKLTQEEGKYTRDANALEGSENRQLSREQASNSATLAKELQGMKDVMTQKGIDIQLGEFEISKLVSLFNMDGPTAKNARDALAQLLNLLNPTPGSTGLNENTNAPSVLEGTYFG